MVRGRKGSKPQSADDPPCCSSRSPHKPQASQVSRFECPLHSCSSSLGSKDALKRHLQSHLLSKDPDISDETIHQAGFKICISCNSVLVTARRNRCNTCTSSCRTSHNFTKSSCSGKSRAPASPAPSACTEHSESSQVSYSPTCVSSAALEQESARNPRSSRVSVGSCNLQPASDPSILVTFIGQESQSHSMFQVPVSGADPERVDRVASHPPPLPLPQIIIYMPFPEFALTP